MPNDKPLSLPYGIEKDTVETSPHKKPPRVTLSAKKGGKKAELAKPAAKIEKGEGN